MSTGCLFFICLLASLDDNCTPQTMHTLAPLLSARRYSSAVVLVREWGYFSCRSISKRPSLYSLQGFRVYAKGQRLRRFLKSHFVLLNTAG